MANSPPLDQAVNLLLKGRAYTLVARLFAETTALADGEKVSELGEVLERVKFPEALERWHRLRELKPHNPAQVEGEHVRLFMQSQASPYETAYGDRSPFSAGPLAQMADIAGFYRAFGVDVRGERPDHLVPELEFISLLYVKEARALLSGELDKAQVCRQARAKFFEQHLGRWLHLFQKKVEETARHPVFATLTALLLALVQADLGEQA